MSPRSSREPSQRLALKLPMKLRKERARVVSDFDQRPSNSRHRNFDMIRREIRKSFSRGASMRTRLVAFLALALFLGGVVAIDAGAGQAGRGGATACDKVCLQGFVEQYLDAWVARDPKRLPLAANVKYTENGQRL